jgi:small subunit ribosomal protein S20
LTAAAAAALDSSSPIGYNRDSSIQRTELANTRSAKKRIRQNEKRRNRNRPVRTRARTQVRAARLALAASDLEKAPAAVLEAVRQLDRAAAAGVIHPRNAARRKSRLMKQLAAKAPKAA